MDVGQLFALLLSIYFVLLAGFAAITTATALEEGDSAGLARRVFWSLTKTTLFLGFPGLIGLLMFLSSESGAGSDSGIMSKNMGLFVMFFFGSLGLLALWVGSITLGFLGAAVTRNLRPTVAAGVLFVLVSGAPLLVIASTALAAAQNQRARRR